MKTAQSSNLKKYVSSNTTEKVNCLAKLSLIKKKHLLLPSDCVCSIDLGGGCIGDK